MLETMGLGLQQDDSIARHSTIVNSSQVSKAHYCTATYNIVAIAVFLSLLIPLYNRISHIVFTITPILMDLLPVLDMSFVPIVITKR